MQRGFMLKTTLKNRILLLDPYSGRSNPKVGEHLWPASEDTTLVLAVEEVATPYLDALHVAASNQKFSEKRGSFDIGRVGEVERAKLYDALVECATIFEYHAVPVAGGEERKTLVRRLMSALDELYYREFYLRPERGLEQVSGDDLFHQLVKVEA
ncbi:hypothetical protein HA052_04750 [Chromobacterium haemolyticum]|uniref:Uncharacterized protein n=1 Tax=Chromobacterium fluminis TaxID=3044269 RepID=A0ABX0L4U1_9NEIS|nr:hypothetical protein [Chromobacterium haemolyticum]NHR04499.1 hypothetical protein [Chromobacterium haemolyticum]